MIDIAARRLRAQRLVGRPFASAAEAVRWLGAVQSQDYNGAKWALGQRTRGTTDAELDQLFDQGAILRTHVMRPTWHFVVPQDIRWLLELTSPRLRAGLAGRYRRLEISERDLARSGAVFARVLAGGHHLTRPELGEVLLAAGISPEGQRLPHLLMRAELDGLIVSGPRRGKQFTYALLEDRVPKARLMERSEGLLELTLRYFRSHGPAQVQDFVWWSGLTTADARTGIANAGDTLQHEVVDGKDYWFGSEARSQHKAPAAAHLLPNFDEYTVAYRDRTAAVHPDGLFDPQLFSFGSILANVVIIGGRVRGAWRRTAARESVRVELRLLDGLKPAEAAALDAARRRLASFLERPVEVVLL